MIRPVQMDLFGVIGKPVGHSLSPAMMNAVFRSFDIPAVYLALETDAPAEDLKLLAKMGFRGLSVTVPHKRAVFSLARETDDTAKAIGAVNTLKLHEGIWLGKNTDWLGASLALKQATLLENKRVCVIGAGGAARAVVFGLKRAAAEVTIFNRNTERGKELAEHFACKFFPLEVLFGMGSEHDFDIVVQCTSVGLAGSDTGFPLSESFFKPNMVVMDVIYRPLLTAFLKAARKAGCTLVPGTEMLIYQGVAQLEWWLQGTIPKQEAAAVMRKALLGILENEQTD